MTISNARYRAASSIVLAFFLGALACSDSGGNLTEPSPVAAENIVSLGGANQLIFEDNGQLASHRGTIERVLTESLRSVRALMPIDGVAIRIRAGTDIIPEIGMGGRALSADTVRMTFNPNSRVLSQSLEEELFPLVAHELHHVARMKTVGYGSTLLEAMVSEGLADQFSIEVADIDPPIWSVALQGQALSDWSERARLAWFDANYDHNAWFLGTTSEIPRWAGYSIGFQLTGAFLDNHPDRRPSGLFAEPARSFLP